MSGDVLADLPDILTWTGDLRVLDGVHERYAGAVRRALGEHVERQERIDPAVAAALRTLLEVAPADMRDRVLLAPESSARLLLPASYPPAATSRFLAMSLKADMLVSGLLTDPKAAACWTATGDALVDGTGRVVRAPVVPGFPPVDIGSPYAKLIDLSGADRGDVPERPDFGDAEVAVATARLTRARDELRRSNPLLPQFVTAFTKTLILQKDPETPRSFASGSNGKYIGRAFLVNPHLPGVTVEVVADAVTHEAIHGLLYMQEREHPWVLDPALHDSSPPVRSPWSGNDLMLRSFLQACFVWYGLLHLWCRCLQAGAFDRPEVERMLLRAVRGFLGPPLVDHLSPWPGAVDESLLLTIAAMQHRVRVAFGGGEEDAGVTSAAAP